jgi:hypothetical protein
MNNPDHDTIIRAVEDARRILGEYRGARSERWNVCLPCSIGATLCTPLTE